MMAGYCSNSPLRCQEAKQLTLFPASNQSCPECGSTLITIKNLPNSSQAACKQQKLMQIGLGVMLSIAIMAIYFTY